MALASLNRGAAHLWGCLTLPDPPLVRSAARAATERLQAGGAASGFDKPPLEIAPVQLSTVGPDSTGELGITQRGCLGKDLRGEALWRSLPTT